jgi:hypothetical protein
VLELLSVPAVIALVEAVKMGGLPSKFAPLVAVACGVVFGFIIGNVVGGLVLGLTASGLYSNVKAFLK